MHDYVTVYTATDSRREADSLARIAVERRLAACAQVTGPLNSTYWWQGKIENAEEWAVWLKTASSRVDDLIAMLKAEHSYELPDIVAMPIIAGHPPYLEWLRRETADQADGGGA